MGAVTSVFESIGNIAGGAVDAVAPVIEAGGDYVANNPTILLSGPAGAIAGAAGAGAGLDAGMGVWGDGAGSAFAAPSALDAGMGVWGDGAGAFSGNPADAGINAWGDGSGAMFERRSPLDAGADNWFNGSLDAANPFTSTASGLQSSLSAPSQLVGESVSGTYNGTVGGGGTGGTSGTPSTIDELLKRFKSDPFRALNTLGTIANLGTSIYGMMQAPKLAQAGQAAAERAAGPWNNMGYQANAATNLNAQLQDPNAYYSTPEYKANEQAVMRKMAMYGNSGNLATALQQSGAQGRNQYLQTLGGFAGVNNNPAAGAALAMQGQTNAANLQMNSLGLAGKTAVAATNNNNNWWS